MPVRSNERDAVRAEPFGRNPVPVRADPDEADAARPLAEHGLQRI
jgi:hypothetical protein